MDFNHSDDRRMLSDSLRRYLAEQYPIQTRNEVAYAPPYHAPDKWLEMAELGIQGALLPPADGGYAGDGFDLLVIFEELGRALCPEPMLATLLSLKLLAAFKQSDTLTRVVEGRHKVAVGIFEPQAAERIRDLTTKAVLDGEAWHLSGRKSIVYGAPCADEILIAAKITDTIGLFSITPKDADIKSYATIDGGGAAEITFDNCPAQLIAENADQALEAALDSGRLALCAEAVGALDVVLAMTADYLQQRKQFGQAIATFQALQHRVVDMANEVEQARSITILAASKLNDEERTKYIAMAKNLVGRACILVAEEAIQLHGGIGMTWEYASSHYSKRLVMIDHQLGDRFQQVHRLLQLAS